MFAFRKRTFVIVLSLTIAADGGHALLSSPAMAADLQLVIKPAMRMFPMRVDRPASASTCSGCVGECRRRGIGPVCEVVCAEACKDK
jgi:hypothetical protein